MNKYKCFYDDVSVDIKMLQEKELSVKETVKKYTNMLRDNDFEKMFSKSFGKVQLICIRGILFSLDIMRLYNEEIITADNVIEMLKGILKIKKLKN